MAVFVAGFLFILGFCILLFLFIDMATSMGAGANKGGEKKWVAFFGVLLSVPVFVYSLAMGMTLATKCKLFFLFVYVGEGEILWSSFTIVILPFTHSILLPIKNTLHQLLLTHLVVTHF